LQAPFPAPFLDCTPVPSRAGTPPFGQVSVPSHTFSHVNALTQTPSFGQTAAFAQMFCGSRTVSPAAAMPPAVAAEADPAKTSAATMLAMIAFISNILRIVDKVFAFHLQYERRKRILSSPHFFEHIMMESTGKAKRIGL
jgi:hypothetical protein